MRCCSFKWIESVAEYRPILPPGLIDSHHYMIDPYLTGRGPSENIDAVCSRRVVKTDIKRTALSWIPEKQNNKDHNENHYHNNA